MKLFEHSPLLTKIYQRSQEMPDKVAIISGDKEVTYSMLVQYIICAARYLCEKGISKGDCIALSAQKDMEFIFIYFASHAIGAVNVIVDSESNPKKLDYILHLMQPKVVFGFEREAYNCVLYKDIVLNPNEQQLVQDSGLKESDTADIIFTTGTTGLPKGVQLSHYNVYSSAENINGFIGNSVDDVEILGLPLCHSFGLGRLRCNLIKGATIVLLGNFANIKLFFSAIEKYGATGFGMVPAIWAYIRKFSGTRISKYSSQIKYIEIGSAAMPIASKEELMQLFPNTRICMHYGLTEASRSAFMEFHENADNLSTIGKPVCEKVDIKVFDEIGKECECGQQGEICIKGNMVMKGYYLEQDNISAFYGEYFRTGDCGYITADGNIYLVSRIKEIINIGGKKVSPQEIEDAICALGVRDCICVGEPDPNGILGEIAKVYVLKDGCDLSFDEIKKGLEGKLESYKIPSMFEWIDEIPKTVSGKKQRLSLKQQ